MQRKRREIVKDRRGVRRGVMGGGEIEWACPNRIILPFKRHFQAVILISY